MAENASQDAKREVVDGLKSILQRVADFFDLFDLSFIISGATALGALGFWAWRAKLPRPPISQGWLYAFAVIIASYVLGLLCFSLGRWLRLSWRWRRLDAGAEDRFLPILKGHGLDSASPFSDYIARTDFNGESRLYVRLWAELRDRPDLTASFSLLRRYWVMAATLDGLVVSLLIWIAVLFACMLGWDGVQPLDAQVGAVSVAMLLIAMLACQHEAGRYVQYQMEELVAAIATKRAMK